MATREKNGGGVVAMAVVMVALLCWASVASAFNFPILSSILTKGFKGADASTKSPTGIPCIGCTLVLTIIEQLSNIHNQTIDEVINAFCDLFPSPPKQTCEYYLDKYGDEVIRLFENGYSTDDICLEIGICGDASCKLNAPAIPPWNSPLFSVPKSFFAKKQNKENIKTELPADFDPWGWLKNITNRFGNAHLPVVDMDNDYFSPIDDLRGAHWRGKDCNDLDAGVHPGIAFNPNQNPQTDYNCNGISGVDASTNLSWEEVLCKNSTPMGVIAVGDSATAHFAIPVAWFNTSQMTPTTFDDLLSVAANEVDWPHLSGYTGFENQSMVDSIYLRMRQRNLCNHRDYQNAGVNGARAGAVASDIIYSVSRDQTNDNPALVFIALIGNDVCSPHEDYQNTMTTPEDFAISTLKTLNYLETILPAGSHVVFIGLANGSLLWDVLNFRLHPIGVTYADLYQYLICQQETPCFVWMNSNETIRNAGTQRAMELSAVYPQIIQNYSSTFKNFDMEYYDYPLEAIGEVWESLGGELWQLIEPCDGFHPNQIANYYFAEVVWGYLERDHPDWLPPPNPNNDLIASMFGDQGGY